MHKNDNQLMKQLNYQKQKQLQDQKCSNENMSYVFSTMESIYFQTTKKPEYYEKVFDYYKINDDFEFKNLEDKLYHLKTQLISYKTSVILYVQEYSYYDFPENYNAEKIQSLLNYWKKNEILREYCESIENLIFNMKKDTKIENFNFLDKINQQTKTTNSNFNEKQKFSVKAIFNQIPVIKNETNNLLENVEQSYYNNGENTKIYINTHSTADKNPIYKNIKRFENINGKTDEEIMKRNENHKNNHQVEKKKNNYENYLN